MSSNTEQVISLLNEALALEYTLIIHYPRLSSMIKDPETRDLVSGLGSASIKHADTVAEAIVRLKGKPIWSFKDSLHRCPTMEDLLPFGCFISYGLIYLPCLNNRLRMVLFLE
jgi:bacterioferritin (cytochrome b1)